MATALRLRRGTTTQHSTFTGAEGEVTVDTTKDTVVVHDGSTAGGFPLARDSAVVHNTGTETVAGLKTFGDGIATDTIAEETSAAGVTIDGVLLKDTTVTANTIKASGTSSSQGEVQLFEDTDNGTNYVALKAPSSVASNVTWTMPSADGTSGQALVTNGSGVLSFAASGSPTTETYDYTDGTSATWTKPAQANWVLIEMWGGGGSGGFGGAGSGGGGGGGGAYNFGLFKFSDLQGAVTYIVGAGGASRATAGNGNTGGQTSVTMATFAGGANKTISAYGGGPGQGNVASGVGGGGGGALSAGAITTIGCTLCGLGGSPNPISLVGERIDNSGFGGANGSRSSVWAGGDSYYGGAGGGFGSGSNTGTVGGNSVYGGAGGGGGEDTGTGDAGGTSIFGGNGSAGTTGTTGSAAGSTPGGGSGGTENAASGKGGDGRVRFTYW